MAIHFYTEEIKFQLKSILLIKKWLKQVAEAEKRRLKSLIYVFCTDEYLLKINQDYLQHDTYTDIITFDQSENDSLVEGEIYISIERVRDNAIELNIDFEAELRRVLVHGLLHLLGHNDLSDAEEMQMRLTEDHYLLSFEQLRVR